MKLNRFRKSKQKTFVHLKNILRVQETNRLYAYIALWQIHLSIKNSKSRPIVSLKWYLVEINLFKPNGSVKNVF